MSRNSTPPPDNDGDDNDDDASLVGRWFSVDGNQGVVRYVGPVSGTRGTWLGVEWADAGRGKHGGTRNGHRYFRCRWAADGNSGGSFIRRVARIDWGQTVLAAARARYAEADGAVVARAIDGRRGRIEAVGFDRVAGQQADLRTLATLGLDSLRVYGVGRNRLEREETRRLLGAGTRTLLLANNYLTRWSAVTDILDALRGVETLDVSANHFATPLVAPPECGSSSGATRLDTLRLDSSPGLTWPDASAAAAQLRARAVSFGWSGVSALASAGVPAPPIDGLEELRLDCNRITDIAALSAQLPRLRVLSLRGNRTLVDILPGNATNNELPVVLFPALESLNLADTGISSWAAVDRLALLPRLATLHLAQTPLFETASSSSPDAARTADIPRAQTVARLARITKLDGSAVSADERADLERYYLALCARQLAESHEQQSPPPSNDNPAAATVGLLAKAFPRIP
ncbi:hypothetical protein H4S06_003734, partial [Coemansia sp. BCRC 34490]